MNNKMKGKTNVETESDESNHHPPTLDLSLMRQPIATSITGFEEVLRAYEAGTNEVSSLNIFSHFHYQFNLFVPSCVNYYRENAISSMSAKCAEISSEASPTSSPTNASIVGAASTPQITSTFGTTASKCKTYRQLSRQSRKSITIQMELRECCQGQTRSRKISAGLWSDYCISSTSRVPVT